METILSNFFSKLIYIIESIIHSTISDIKCLTCSIKFVTGSGKRYTIAHIFKKLSYWHHGIE